MAAIELQQVSKIYTKPYLFFCPKEGFQALHPTDLVVQEGAFFGLLGPNGAGKTTIISILAGLSKPTTGVARICGYDVQTQYRQARRCLGVVPQELVYDPFFTVRQVLRFQSGYYGLHHNDDWIDEILHHLGLMDKAQASMRELSGGMKRRVLVAQALVHRPQVIILDEPTAGVDVDLRLGLWKFIRRLNEQGHTIILTTHYLSEAQEMCNEVAFLKKGRIIAKDHPHQLNKKYDSQHLDDTFLKIMQEP